MVSEVKYSSRAKFLSDNSENIFYHFQGTQETEADSLLIRVSEGIIKEATYPNTREATKEVVSEDEDHLVSFETLDYLNESLSKGSGIKIFPTLFRFVRVK